MPQTSVYFVLFGISFSIPRGFCSFLKKRLFDDFFYRFLVKKRDFRANIFFTFAKCAGGQADRQTDARKGENAITARHSAKFRVPNCFHVTRPLTPPPPSPLWPGVAFLAKRPRGLCTAPNASLYLLRQQNCRIDAPNSISFNVHRTRPRITTNFTLRGSSMCGQYYATLVRLISNHCELSFRFKHSNSNISELAKS
ncbi:Insulin receptor substrate 1 [Frankliniella fusca]|uniref:Insulin receptor substrate 1 n=1 Tax=Frankliniella fusca TaxID=407009 RepID=A0AAE1LUZ2_9NEOP|nr:Insulin receptor substrate 1 [Frankliniella fusca]